MPKLSEHSIFAPRTKRSLHLLHNNVDIRPTISSTNLLAGKDDNRNVNDATLNRAQRQLRETSLLSDKQLAQIDISIEHHLHNHKDLPPERFNKWLCRIIQQQFASFAKEPETSAPQYR